MSRTRPRVGVSVGHIHADPGRKLFKGKELQFVEQKMAMSVWRTGALPIVLPDLRDPEAFPALVEDIDGLLLQGGADVAPASYGQVPADPAWAGDVLRDRYEIALVEAALAANKPILGICRGAQLLNVALGGTLVQDIDHAVDDALAHRSWHRYELIEHDVDLSPDSWIRDTHGGADSILVNTIHHQSVDAVGEGLRVTARAPDGVVEAIERIDPDGPTGPGTWAVGVQWHPEWLDGSPEGGPHREHGDAIFRGFAALCAARSDRMRD